MLCCYALLFHASRMWNPNPSALHHTPLLRRHAAALALGAAGMIISRARRPHARRGAPSATKWSHPSLCQPRRHAPAAQACDVGTRHNKCATFFPIRVALFCCWHCCLLACLAR